MKKRYFMHIIWFLKVSKSHKKSLFLKTKRSRLSLISTTLELVVLGGITLETNK